jgi:hypothetical protein
MAGKWKQGTYEPINKEKYKGSYPIVYRSSWEKRVFYFLDTHPAIIEWGSESIVIPYKFTIDGQMHRYFIDVNFIVNNKKGEQKRYLIEIKPFEQTQPPIQPKRKSQKAIQRYNQALLTYQKNLDKWKAAKEWAKKRGYIFDIWTEKTLGLK